MEKLGGSGADAKSWEAAMANLGERPKKVGQEDNLNRL